MSDLAIVTHGLGKRYRVSRQAHYRLFGDWLTSLVAAPFRKLAAALSRNGRPTEEEGTIWALRDVNLEIRRGESVGLIGRNGAGKSTLLKILSRITEPTEGSAEIRGRIGSLLEVGTGFHSELTGRENVYLSGAILGMKRAEIDRRFDEIVGFAEVEKFIDTPIKRYSSGMQVRLAFSVAAHLQSDILLVDEVLAVGDVAFQKKCLEKMEGVRREDRTVVFVSHNMQTISTLCRRGILLSGGKVILDADASKAISAYLASVRPHQRMVDGRVPLEGHPGKKGNFSGPLELTWCRLEDREGRPIESLPCGGELRIGLGFRATGDVARSHVSFWILFNHPMRGRLFGCSNDVIGRAFPLLPREGEVWCTLPRVPLVPGTYSIDLVCMVGPMGSDCVYDATQFEVEIGDYYGTGRLPEDGWGNALVDYRWSLARTEQTPS